MQAASLETRNTAPMWIVDAQHLDELYTDSYPCLTCSETIQHLRQTKVMFIMRGLPGSGKSTLAKKLEGLYSKSIVVCSADDYYCNDEGVYQYNPDKIHDAHRACQEKAEEACKNNTLTVIIDNTNIRLDECRAYFQKASNYGYLVLIIEPRTSWKRDVDILAVRNIHRVPREKIEARLKQYHPIIPFYFGLFLNKEESNLILAQANEFYQQALKSFPPLKSDLERISRQKKVPVELLINRANMKTQTKFLHCTMKFIGKLTEQSRKEYANYAENRIVSHMMGKMCPGYVKGFIITPRTLAARLLFTDHHTRVIWDQDDNESFSLLSAPSSNSRGRSSRRQNQASATTTNQSIDDDDDDACEMVMAKSVVDDDLLLVNKIENMNIEPEETSFFRPTFGFLSRAHLTCGVSPGVSAGQAGIDMVHMIRQEGDAIKGRRSLETVEDERMAMRYFSDGQCIVYLKKSIPIHTVFSGFFH